MTVNKGVEVLKISPSELYSNSKKIQWMNSNSEINFNGDLYDVLHVKNNGTVVLLYVFNDKKEADLFKEFKKQVNGLNTESESPENATDLLEDICDFEFISTTFMMLHSPNEGTVNYLNPQFKLSSGFSTILIPPPNA